MRLTEQIGLTERELVSLVGGGGKSTLLFCLGRELAVDDQHVVLTTTTKMGRDQIDRMPNVCSSVECAGGAPTSPGPIMLVTGGDSHKITGPPPGEIDDLFRYQSIDFILVEADGAHGRPLKAPASHEPVIPACSTTVVVAMGIDAVGQRLDEASHRVSQAMEFSGLTADHLLTAEDCASILVHPNGALRAIPKGARVVVALTKVRTEPGTDSAGRVVEALAGHLRIDDVVIIPEHPSQSW